jgi:acetylornithine deacetylase/succinyl-diaminopimelate desuccinylase-like protein
MSLFRLSLLLLFVLPLTAQTPDWPQVRQEALDTLVDLVKLRTSQPEGNEILAANYLKKKLDAEGIASEIFEAGTGRASIVARVKGNGNKKPLLLLGHLDVVAVERDEW